MPKAYSQDLRERVLQSVCCDGMSCRRAVVHYQMAPSTVILWARRLKETGQRIPKGTGVTADLLSSLIMIGF